MNKTIVTDKNDFKIEYSNCNSEPYTMNNCLYFYNTVNYDDKTESILNIIPLTEIKEVNYIKEYKKGE